MSADRDIQTNFAKIVDSFPLNGHSAAAVAQEVIDHLTEHDPELLANWLMLHAETIVTGYISKRYASQRAAWAKLGPRSAFADAAKAYEAGDRSAFDALYEVDVAHTRKRLGSLTKTDAQFVAAHYEERSRTNAFEAVLFRALAKRLKGDQTVEDVLTESEWFALRAAQAAAA